MAIILTSLAEERLRSEELVWLSGVRPDGRPHTVPVWFLWEHDTVLIFSKPDTQKLRNLRLHPAVTLALDNAKQGIVILEGTATLLEKGGARESLPAYAEKYREGLQRFSVTAEQFTMLYSQPIRITLARLVRW
ncbi:TIGR03667 family PPOX class F420-dependent oxidoreductase [Dictyobacter arantiisoli]|uniref:Pyridoxamine 5'-phosphate oxidase N-terminal domain-containing protein n=1 Tax=Dictyobacter arantiisoli TaxID=2014874 RepID=A0A5A5THT6_9CHLR|nr:TIGR03667 family PPOX class F420-dependent oxidoreductase [Dictyobacter arantiisoli]GCF11150.1 hypothetical protein KDI_47140 [Dictyobacter arantiisoli]